MFFTHEYKMSTGVVLTYWEVVEFYGNTRTGMLQAKLFGYLSQEEKELGADKVMEMAVDYAVNPQHEAMAPMLGLILQLTQEHLALKLSAEE